MWAWIKAHNRQVKQQGGVRILACRLPSKSPWLNPIEPKWAHGKKAISEPDRLLTVPRNIAQYILMDLILIFLGFRQLVLWI